MELFVVDRYWGNKENKKVKENDHLSKLLEKIEQRKKLKKSLDQQRVLVSDDSERVLERQKKKKRKKENKTTEEDEEKEISSVENENIDTQEVLVSDGSERVLEKQKKKRRKKENKTTEEDEEKEISSVENENIDKQEVLVSNDPERALEKQHKKKKHKKENKTTEEDEEKEISSVENENIDKEWISDTREEEADNVEQNEKEETDDENEECESHNKKLSIDKSENETSDFAIIGDYKFNKKKKVPYVLPKWLSKPSLISTDLKNLTLTVDDIPDLNTNLVEILKKKNFTHFFPVQAELIPFLLKVDRETQFMWPNDVCVSAPTGSGKTLAFILPIVQILQKKFDRHIRALVVLPVQDLAAQVAKVFETFTAHTNLRVVLTMGSTSLQEEQKRLVRKRYCGKYESLADILVTTPGRLVEHLISTEGFTLKHLRFIVIDEADRVMDRIQHDWLYYLEKNLSVPGCPVVNIENVTTLPKRPQKLLFSATLSVDPEKLSQLNLMRPKLFTSVAPNKEGKNENVEFIGQFTTPEELTEYMTVCELPVKPLVLYHLLAKNEWRHVLIFALSKKAAHKLAIFLHLISKKVKRKLHVAEISSDFSIIDRDKVLADFAADKIDVLISTDKLSRGMDIPDVHCVISYDIPKKITNYIHRVGRTGRAGKDGTTVTILTPQQKPVIYKFMRKTGKVITELTVPESELIELESVYQETLLELKSHIDKEEFLEKTMIKKVRKQSEEVRKILTQQKAKKRKSEHQNDEKPTKISTSVSIDHIEKKKHRKKK